jgi:hypothetical protein
MLAMCFPRSRHDLEHAPRRSLSGIAFPGVGEVHDVTVADDRRMQFATAAATGH